MKIILTFVEGRQAPGYEGRLFGEMTDLPEVGAKMVVLLDPIDGNYFESTAVTSVHPQADGTYLVKTRNSTYNLIITGLYTECF